MDDLEFMNISQDECPGSIPRVLKVSLMNLFLAKSMVVSEMIILNFWYIIVLIVAKSADT